MATQTADNPHTASSTVSGRWVFDFAEGAREMRDLLGGKGANVAEMTRVLGPERVPAGFTITTEACVAYMHEQILARSKDATQRALAEAEESGP